MQWFSGDECRRSNNDIKPCVAVVVAVDNEGRTVTRILDLVLAQRPVQDVIVVDDGSTDGSWDILQYAATRDSRVALFRHSERRGKGAALATGVPKAKAPFVIFQDADLEYDPYEYFLLLTPLLEERADVVFGSRFGNAGEHRTLYYWHAVGNRILTTLSNVTTNLNLTDIAGGYKAFHRDVLARISISESGFGVEAELAAKCSRLGLRLYEVPISYHGRTYAEGKKTTWRTGFRMLWCIGKHAIAG